MDVRGRMMKVRMFYQPFGLHPNGKNVSNETNYTSFDADSIDVRFDIQYRIIINTI